MADSSPMAREQHQLPIESVHPNDERPIDDPERRDRLQRYNLCCTLEAKLGRSVKLVMSNNRRTMISVKRDSDHTLFRLNRMFLDAPHEIVCALVDFARHNSKPARQRLRHYIIANQALLPARTPRPLQLRPLGAVFDLEEIADKLNRQYFSQLLQVPITWGRFGRARGVSRRHLRLGAYFPKQGVIRIHPILDQAAVPAFFIESVIYHELLHAFLDKEVPHHRGCGHSSLFRELEQKFVDYERAREWEAGELPKLANFSPV